MLLQGRLAGQLGRLMLPCRADWANRAALDVLLDAALEFGGRSHLYER
ncbi:MAG: hypothetical protein WBG92_07110 [Thiohalocapsa sp.]